MGKRQGKTRVQREGKEKLKDCVTVHLCNHKPSQTGEQVGGKTERESFYRNIFLLEAAMTNLPFPLWGKRFQASHISKIFAERKAVWPNRSKRWLCGSSPLAQPKAGHSCSQVATPGPVSVHHGLEASYSPRPQLASFLCPQRNPRGSAASPAHVRLAPLPGGYSVAARWPLHWLLLPTRKEGTGHRWPNLFSILKRKHQGTISM